MAIISNENIALNTVFVLTNGIEQTNRRFFQVIGKTGKQTLIIREIEKHKIYNSDYNDRGYCFPVKNNFIGEQLKKRLSYNPYREELEISYDNKFMEQVKHDKHYYFSEYA